MLNHLLTSHTCSEYRAECGFGSPSTASSTLVQPALHKTVFYLLHSLLVELAMHLMILKHAKWNKGWGFFKLKLKNLDNLYVDKTNLLICPMLQRLKLFLWVEVDVLPHFQGTYIHMNSISLPQYLRNTHKKYVCEIRFSKDRLR